MDLFKRSKLPVINQTEASECGLACIAMVAVYHGHDIDLNSLRVKHPVSLKGVVLDTLIEISENLDLGARALRLDISDINQLTLPAILHWDLNHYVVLKSASKRKYTIHDPARGELTLTENQMSDHFTGVALELTPTQAFQKQEIKKEIRFNSLWGKLIGLKRAITHTFTLSALIQLTILASPFYLQLVVDEAILKFDLNFLLVLAIGFGLLRVVNSLTVAMRSWTILHYGNQTAFQLIANVFSHLMLLPLDYFEKRHAGDVISRLGSTGPIQNALTQSVVAAVIDGLMAVFTGIIIFIYSPLLGFVVLISVFVLLIVTLLYYPVMRRKQEEIIIREAKLETYVIECLKAISTIKLFAAQPQRISTWRNLFIDKVNSNVSLNKYQIIMSTLHSITTGLQSIVVVYLGAKLILEGEVAFTIGMLFAFMAYRQHFTQSVSSLMEKIIEFRLLSLHLERISDITQAESEDDKSVPQTELLIKDSSVPIVEFRDVYFRFSDSDPWILCGVNLKIYQHDFVAIYGGSGGGKTTLLKLLLGLYKPTEGEIIFSGEFNSSCTLDAWRKIVGVVMQDDQLLSGTIADNISFFDSEMDMSRVVKVAGLSQVHDFVSSMPMKYNSFIGDMGSVLSAGQKQRVLLARALYKNPQVLVLDEGTANLDKPTERKIIDLIKTLPITRIVVAHGSSFEGNANRVLELKAGRIVEKY